MPFRKLKPGVFLLEGLNSFAVVFYFYYFYFFMQTRHGFDNRANLELAALTGAVSALWSWLGGNFGQRFGYFKALKIGWGHARGDGGRARRWSPASDTSWSRWLRPSGCVSPGPTSRAGLRGRDARRFAADGGHIQRRVGGDGGGLNFIGGALLTQFGLNSLFYIPALIHIAQLGLTFRLESRAAGSSWRSPPPGSAPRRKPGPRQCRRRRWDALRRRRRRKFLRMAWLANPFAYIAINTLRGGHPRPGAAIRALDHLCRVLLLGLVFRPVRDVLHAVALERLALPLPLAVAGLPGPHRDLHRHPDGAESCGAPAGPSRLRRRRRAHVLFFPVLLDGCRRYQGRAWRPSRGGHRAGQFRRPAVGAASLYFLPQYANAGALAVSGLLTLGLAGLTGIWAVAADARGDRRPRGKAPLVQTIWRKVEERRAKSEATQGRRRGAKAGRGIRGL